jgi:hypothetical protein
MSTESDTHGVNAVLHRDGTITVADSMGGGVTLNRYNARDGIAEYVRRIADAIADEIVDELGLDDDTEEDGYDDE